MNEITDLANLMVDIVDYVCDCLESTAQETTDGNAVTATGRPDHCSVYWSTPPDDLDCGDCGTNGGLYVWLERISPSAGPWPVPWTQAVTAANTVTVPAAIALRLIRPCWPVVGQSGMYTPFPSRETTEDHAVNLLIDAATVECCLLSAAVGRTGPFASCMNVTVPALTPDINRSACAGFTVRMMVDLGACCTPS